MTTTLAVLVFFALGFVGEVGLTLYYLSVSRGRASLASPLSGLIMLFNFWVFNEVAVPFDWMRAAAFALGNSIGCLVVMRWQGGNRHRHAV